MAAAEAMGVLADAGNRGAEKAVAGVFPYYPKVATLLMVVQVEREDQVAQEVVLQT
jgi:hypothetical protein